MKSSVFAVLQRCRPRPGWAVLASGMLAVVACGSENTAPPPETTCAIQRVLDGDTVNCLSGIRVRLIGIDAPELDQMPFGDQSKAALESLLPAGDTVRIERDIDEFDKYGRTLGYLWRLDTMVNEVLVREGWAVTLFIPPNLRYQDRLTAAEEQAKQEGAGLWGTGGFTCLPSDHRAGIC